MNTPSIKTIEKGLNLDREQAAKIKNLISGKATPKDMPEHCHYSHKISAILKACNTIGEFHGVEYIADKIDRYNYIDCFGLSYLNAGDTYATTLVYDHTTGRYSVTSIGDIMENPRHAKRFE